jgi:hypothetical protein
VTLAIVAGLFAAAAVAVVLVRGRARDGAAALATSASVGAGNAGYTGDAGDAGEPSADRSGDATAVVVGAGAAGAACRLVRRADVVRYLEKVPERMYDVVRLGCEAVHEPFPDPRADAGPP